MLKQFFLPSDERRYQRELERRVGAAWSAGKRDLQSICRRAAGAFPLDVLETARDLMGVKLEHGNPEMAVDSAATLPEPLLIDCDWRFDVASARYLARNAATCGRVLCIGAPTVFLQLTALQADTVLVDRNSGLGHALGTGAGARVFYCDIREGLPRGLGLFDAVVLDPPWYLTEYRKWLSAVLPALKRSGTAFIVLFPELTRPTASRQRVELLKVFSSIGDVRVLPRPVRYVTPSFEHSVFAGACIPPLPAWRLASVVALNVRQLQPVTDSQDRFQSRPKRAWKRYQIRGRTIAHEELGGDQRPVAHRPLPGRSNFLLDTVSSRAFDDSAINMITSRNLAGIVQGTEKITGMLALLESGCGSTTAISRVSAGDAVEGLALKRIIDDFELLI